MPSPEGITEYSEPHKIGARFFMGTHTLVISHRGYTEDAYYFCSDSCMARRVWSIAGIRDDSRFKEGKRTKDKYVFEWNACGNDTNDYDVWCAACGDFLRHGMNCECADTETDREPLTISQLRMI